VTPHQIQVPSAYPRLQCGIFQFTTRCGQAWRTRASPAADGRLCDCSSLRHADLGLVSCLASSRSAPTPPGSRGLRVVLSRDALDDPIGLACSTASFAHGMHIRERIASPESLPCPCTLTIVCHASHTPLLRSPSAAKDTVAARVSAPQGPATLHVGDCAQGAKQGPLLLH